MGAPEAISSGAVPRQPRLAPRRRCRRSWEAMVKAHPAPAAPHQVPSLATTTGATVLQLGLLRSPDGVRRSSPSNGAAGSTPGRSASAPTAGASRRSGSTSSTPSTR